MFFLTKLGIASKHNYKLLFASYSAVDNDFNKHRTTLVKELKNYLLKEIDDG